MAYVHAENFGDLLMAQGFVTAQDRLFQMQLTRLAVQGRICELAGRSAKDFDVRMRTIGLQRMAERQANHLDNQTKQFFQQYVDGINGFIDCCPDDLHLEFKLAGIRAEKWQWGKLHTLELVNPIRRKGLGKTLLGTGPMPVGGSGETLYRGLYDFNTPFAVTHCASLRMVVDLSDRDKILAVLPGGVTGRTFDPHQRDQINAFMSGERRYWWFSDRAIDEHQTSKYVLNP